MGGQPANTGTTARLAPASDIVYLAQLTVRAQNVGSAAAKAAQIAEGGRAGELDPSPGRAPW
jgi:hypothetical protein